MKLTIIIICIDTLTIYTKLSLRMQNQEKKERKEESKKKKVKRPPFIIDNKDEMFVVVQWSNSFLSTLGKSMVGWWLLIHACLPSMLFPDFETSFVPNTIWALCVPSLSFSTCLPKLKFYSMPFLSLKLLLPLLNP